MSIWEDKKVKGEGQRKRKAEERRRYKIRTPEVIFIYSKRGSKINWAKRKSNLHAFLMAFKALSYFKKYLEGSNHDHHLPAIPLCL